MKRPIASIKRTTNSFKLVPELVPEPLWGISAFRLLGRTAVWKKIRSDFLQAAGNCCDVCKSRIGVACHDKWRYDDENGIAELIGFEIRCADCHNATHIGRAGKIGFLELAMAQLCSVNGCAPTDALRLFDDAMETWKKRSLRNWTVIVSTSLLSRYPQLRPLHKLSSDSRLPQR